MQLPCLCVVEDKYLPLVGGERLYECEHHQWIIMGKRTITTEFYARKKDEKNE